MLKSFSIHNLILIEEAHLTLDQGLTIITGETGSGKTALIEALHLIFGQRAETDKIRKGCEKTVIQATFDVQNSALIPLFEEAGLSFDPAEELVLTREIHSSGKSRSFAANQPVSATFLQKLSPLLIDFIDQHAYMALKNPEQQRALLDQFGSIDTEPFQKGWKEEKRIEEEIKGLTEKQPHAQKRRELLLEQIQELEAVEGEDEEQLFEEYTRLAHTQELIENADVIVQGSEELLQILRKLDSTLKAILKLDKSLSSAETLVKEAHMQLVELHQLFQSYPSKLESDPLRQQRLEDRLKTLTSLKKRYGKELKDALIKAKEELVFLETLEEKIAALHLVWMEAKTNSSDLCKKLSTQRKKASKQLETLLTPLLRELNMQDAELLIQCTPCARNMSGEDQIIFLLKANKGEQAASVREQCSGGELSRLLFAFKLVLAEKSGLMTMVFDEIDANVGGKTSSIMGAKLADLGRIRQVLCITHFPQLAKQADHHIRVYKEEKEGRTRCKMEALSPETRESELLRMLGVDTTA